MSMPPPSHSRADPWIWHRLHCCLLSDLAKLNSEGTTWSDQASAAYTSDNVVRNGGGKGAGEHVTVARVMRESAARSIKSGKGRTYCKDHQIQQGSRRI